MNKLPKGYGAPLREKKLPPLPGESFDDGFDEDSDVFKHLMSLKMREAMMSDEERTSPDTYGCDCVFLEHFITPEMENDFTIIARDFLIHEFQNIKDYDMIRYVDTDAGVNCPERIFQRFILNLMMNAANQGSVYARNLFLYLYIRHITVRSINS